MTTHPADDKGQYEILSEEIETLKKEVELLRKELATSKNTEEVLLKITQWEQDVRKEQDRIFSFLFNAGVITENQFEYAKRVVKEFYKKTV